LTVAFRADHPFRRFLNRLRAIFDTWTDPLDRVNFVNFAAASPCRNFGHEAGDALIFGKGSTRSPRISAGFGLARSLKGHSLRGMGIR